MKFINPKDNCLVMFHSSPVLITIRILMSSFNAIPLITDAARRRLVFLPISLVVQSST